MMRRCTEAIGEGVEMRLSRYPDRQMLQAA